MPEQVRRRDIKKFIENIGGVVVQAVRTKHWHVTYTYHGHELKTIFPASPSDHRWAKNKQAQLKHEIQARGLWDEKD